MTVAKPNWIWLSHSTNIRTPAYGNGIGFKLKQDKDQSKGASCNQVFFSMPNHLGSHVDAPKHFFKEAKSINEYKPEDWIFEKPFLIDLSSKKNEIVNIECFNLQDHYDPDVDLILIKTGIEKYRGEDKFWKKSPIFDPTICSYLLEKYPSMKAIGIDAISISSLQNRELGRSIHRAFLSKDIRIFEDLSLKDISIMESLEMVIALPFRFDNADGAPSSVIAQINVNYD